MVLEAEDRGDVSSLIKAESVAHPVAATLTGKVAEDPAACRIVVAPVRTVVESRIGRAEAAKQFMHPRVKYSAMLVLLSPVEHPHRAKLHSTHP